MTLLSFIIIYITLLNYIYSCVCVCVVVFNRPSKSISLNLSSFYLVSEERFLFFFINLKCISHSFFFSLYYRYVCYSPRLDDNNTP